jgi:hypothetical protein
LHPGTLACFGHCGQASIAILNARLYSDSAGKLIMTAG